MYVCRAVSCGVCVYFCHYYLAVNGPRLKVGSACTYTHVDTLGKAYRTCGARYVYSRGKTIAVRYDRARPVCCRHVQSRRPACSRLGPRRQFFPTATCQLLSQSGRHTVFSVYVISTYIRQVFSFFFMLRCVDKCYSICWLLCQRSEKAFTFNMRRRLGNINL